MTSLVRKRVVKISRVGRWNQTRQSVTHLSGMIVSKAQSSHRDPYLLHRLPRHRDHKSTATQQSMFVYAVQSKIFQWISTPIFSLVEIRSYVSKHQRGPSPLTQRRLQIPNSTPQVRRHRRAGCTSLHSTFSSVSHFTVEVNSPILPPCSSSTCVYLSI
ncbi:hypothetical protein VTK56DRAFT_5330 [Thermocarpiscus australiensis]